MPHFDQYGNETWICQICGRIKPSSEISDWRPEVTENRSAGNVCLPCLETHQASRLTGQALRARVQLDRERGPLSLTEHCQRESGGLTGPRLRQYINRYYGHS